NRYDTSCSCATVLASHARDFSCFFFNDTATPEISTLSLHDALPISATTCPTRGGSRRAGSRRATSRRARSAGERVVRGSASGSRSEEHTSELQSLTNLVCRLLLEKKKKRASDSHTTAKLHSAARALD